MPDDKDDHDPIVDLMGRLGAAPDLGEMARSRVASAQQRLALSDDEFAAELDRMVDWDVSPEAVKTWTTKTTPPGDIVVAAELLVLRASGGTDQASVGIGEGHVVHGPAGERLADLIATFPSRAAFTSAMPPHQLFQRARDVSISGLSLNLICQQYPDQQLRELIEGGCTMRCLFLLPYGESVQNREREEDYPPGHLSMLTEMNMHILARLRSGLSDAAQPRLRIRTYDEPLRFNIVLIDRRLAVIQPYMPAVRGVDSPTFLLRQLPSGQGLMPAFETVFGWLWDRGKPADEPGRPARNR
jgi:Domain of unknown function (DUF5919)